MRGEVIEKGSHGHIPFFHSGDVHIHIRLGRGDFSREPVIDVSSRIFTLLERLLKLGESLPGQLESPYLIRRERRYVYIQSYPSR